MRGLTRQEAAIRVRGANREKEDYGLVQILAESLRVHIRVHASHFCKWPPATTQVDMQNLTFGARYLWKRTSLDF